MNHEVTLLLERARDGDPDALDRLVPLVYDELRALARRQRQQRGADETLNTTALVHEAYERMSNADSDYANRQHFFRVAARVMRSVIVDRARAQNAIKRGGGDRPLALDEERLVPPDRADEVLALDEALEPAFGAERAAGRSRAAPLLRRPHDSRDRRGPRHLPRDGQARVDRRAGVAPRGAGGMTAAERHSRATALFLATADLAPEAREATLEAEADAEIRDAARALLRGHDSATGPLDAPAVSPLAATRVTGREIGPWRITGRLGSGGMAAVYRAERADGLYDREVALKLLAPGVALAGGEWLARRLDAERRILARLEHPGIARLSPTAASPTTASPTSRWSSWTASPSPTTPTRTVSTSARGSA